MSSAGAVASGRTTIRVSNAPFWPLPAGALLAAAAVGAGAFGAHGLASRLDVRSLALWETATRYLMYGALGLVALGLAVRVRPAAGWRWRAAAWALFGGAVVFSSTVGALALGAPRLLGAVTPLGGLGMIAGFVLFAWAAVGGDDPAAASPGPAAGDPRR